MSASLEALYGPQERVLDELRRIRVDIGDLRTEITVQTAVTRRIDHNVQSLIGEVRASKTPQELRASAAGPSLGQSVADDQS